LEQRKKEIRKKNTKKEAKKRKEKNEDYPCLALLFKICFSQNDLLDLDSLVQIKNPNSTKGRCFYQDPLKSSTHALNILKLITDSQNSTTSQKGNLLRRHRVWLTKTKLSRRLEIEKERLCKNPRSSLRLLQFNLGFDFDLIKVRRLQMELNRRDNIEADDTAEGLKRVIAALEKENNSLKMAKVELETSLKAANENSNKQSTSLSENVQSLGSFPEKEEMELSLQKVEKDLKETGQQRDKALQELSRLKKHLLDKEIEESEKMDEDSKIIEELKEKNEYQRLQILHLEKALKQAIASQEEVKMINNNELQKYKEIIDDLNRKLTSCMSTIDAKNVELLNLQTALGSYYAELEAKEHLEGDLAHAREESAKLAELLKDAHQKAEISRKEKEDILEKLSQSERILAEGRNRVNKLAEDNAKLHRALEQMNKPLESDKESMQEVCLVVLRLLLSMKAKRRL
ncbi:Golgin candidate 3, partial [Camellia lanceoleosa]